MICSFTFFPIRKAAWLHPEEQDRCFSPLKMQFLHTSEDYCSCFPVQPPLSGLAGSSLLSLSPQDVFWTPCSFSLCCLDPVCLSHSVSAQSRTWGSLQRFPPCLVGYAPFTHPSRMFGFVCACDGAALFVLGSWPSGSSPADLLSSELCLHCVFRLLTFPI